VSLDIDRKVNPTDEVLSEWQLLCDTTQAGFLAQSSVKLIYE
jgi:hypothetical protein